MYLSVLCLRPSWSAADARAGAVPTRTRAARPPRAAHPEPARRQRGVHQWICATPRATHSALRRRPRDRRTGGRIYHHLARRADGAAFVGPVPPLLVHGIRGLSAGSPRNAVLHTARYTLRATHCALHTAHTLLHTLLHTARTLLHTAHYTLRARCYTRVQQPCPQTLTWGRQFDYPYDWEKFKPSNELRAERHDHHALRARLWGERVAQHVEAGCEGDWTVSYGHGRDMAWVSRLSHRSWCPSGLPDPMLQCGRWCFDGRRLCAKPDAAMVHQWEAAEDMHGGVGGAKMHPAQLLQRF